MKRMAHFKHWFALGALLVAALGFARLGLWQLDRADSHRAVAASFADAAGQAPVAVPATPAEAEARRYRRLELAGHYRAGVQILLDNLTAGGQAGYQVLTPLDIGRERLVLVNRGWVPAAPDRRELPELGLPHAAASPGGRIDRLPRAGLVLAAPPAEIRDGLLVLSFPDFTAIEAGLGRTVYPFQLLLDPDAPDGFRRDWGPDADRADRSFGYAVQWFGLAGLALVLGSGYAWRLRRRVVVEPGP